MSATKFIRVSCTLPVGVVFESSVKTRLAARGFEMMDRFYGEGRLDPMSVATRKESSSGPLTLTLEVPLDRAKEAAAALRALVEDLER